MQQCPAKRNEKARQPLSEYRVGQTTVTQLG
jgi:hypothetical protein